MSQAKLMYLHALTPLHPGCGTALGVVDLPVQRERHTQWPVIPASTIKGVLRDRFREAAYQNDRGHTRTDHNSKNNDLVAIFGPDTKNASDHGGALAISDGRILGYPVRSMHGVFAWVTCPTLLIRFSRDRGLAGLCSLPVPISPERSKAFFSANGILAVNSAGNRVLALEEYEFSHAGEIPTELIAVLTEGVDKDSQNILKDRLVVLADDDFTHFVRHATEVSARIALDYESKTVKKGALFYQEFLPPECLFYTLLIAEDSRSKNHHLSASQALQKVSDLICGKTIQIGGDESTGKGICKVQLID